MTFRAIAWPPQSPDPKRVEFFMWGHLKEYFRTEPAGSIADFVARIQALLARACFNVLRRVKEWQIFGRGAVMIFIWVGKELIYKNRGGKNKKEMEELSLF